MGSSGVDLHDVGGLLSPLTLRGIELDHLAFAQCSESVRQDRGVVYEKLLSRILTDESISLGFAEPLDRSAVSQMRMPSFRSEMVGETVATPAGRYMLTPFGVRTDWKQSRQYTGLPGVGRNGTCVGVPHEVQTASWNSRDAEPLGPGEAIIPPGAPVATRFFSSLHLRQRVGSCWKPRSL